MKTLADHEPVQPQRRPVIAPEVLPQRLAEAARYAILLRVAPALRHDVAGLMQPVGMLTKILQRRVQMTEPDLQEITKNLATVGGLVKEATAGCMSAIGWMISGEDTPFNLRSGVNEAVKLLQRELFLADMAVLNDIFDEQASVPQSFVRSAVMGALLAFCDQRTTGHTLQLTLEPTSGSSDASGALLLRMLPGEALNEPVSKASQDKFRKIDWDDVEAMAGSFNVTMARGEGWLRLGLPKTE